MMKALIIGATGLVGKEILKIALNRPDISAVSIFVRRSTGLTHSKLVENIVSFDEISSWQDKLQGEVLFSALGSTKKAAGSEAALYKVDFEYQYEVARAAANNGVKKLILISSTGANARSPFFYLKTKGELEEAVKALGFQGLVILRPSLLEGDREKPRKKERISQFFLSKIPRSKMLASLIPVKAEGVAMRSVELALSRPASFITVEAQDFL